jgi:hypothetical protein
MYTHAGPPFAAGHCAVVAVETSQMTTMQGKGWGWGWGCEHCLGPNTILELSLDHGDVLTARGHISRCWSFFRCSVGRTKRCFPQNRQLFAPRQLSDQK